MIAVLLVASMVVVYALSHLATLWGRPPTVEGSIVGVEQPVSVDVEQPVSVDVDGEVLVAQPG